MKRNITVLALCAMLFIFCLPIQAQQTGKDPRIGFLDISNASGMAGLLEAFRHELNKLGWVEGKILPSKTDLQRVKMTVSLSLRRTWSIARLM